MSTATLAEPKRQATPDAWKGFAPGIWQKKIDVRDFIQQN